MNRAFGAMVQRLPAKYTALMSMKPVVAENIPANTSKGGVYLFSEGKNHLYAGRTKRRISRRVRAHFGTAKDLPFAWRLAREKTGMQAAYKGESTRKALLKNPKFKAAYDKAKARIRKMQVRYVGERDPVRQALLEVYAAVTSRAKHNDFRTS